jgi:phosphatidate cytidylyltransferase
MPDKFASAKPGPASAALIAARNLQQRVASGIVMVLIALAVVYSGSLPFALLVIAIGLIMSWEWGHMIRGIPGDAGFNAHAVSVAVGVMMAVIGYPGLALAVLCVGALIVYAMTVTTHPALSAGGVVYVGLASLSMVWLRCDPAHGFAAIVFLFLIVWTTDTMAFAIGRAVGGPKLWLSISPNKTWSGFLGGISSSALLSACYAGVVTGASSWRLFVIGLVLGIVAQGGDLAESALKRRVGVKDASNFIPGHGGVMDRMDGIVAAAFAAACFAVVWNAAAPASALLIGG